MPVLPAKLLRGALVLAAVSVSAPGAAQPAAPVAGPPLGVTGEIRFHGAFASRFIASRNVEVWLPPEYERAPRARYPVLYMHDGQNVFAPATSYGGVDWAVDEVMTRLIAERKVRPAIVVAVWNSPSRFAEYMPEKALTPTDSIPAGALLSDEYLRFLVEELKPFIDRSYRTRTGPEDTFIMGSSMGGLISAYALTEYPAVFGAAACVSTHWPAAEGAVVEYLRRSLPSPATHRLYFDHGTATLDSLYAPFQRQADEAMRQAGYTPGRNWVTRVFEGAEHSERAWRVRVEEPLRFLLGR